MSRIIRLEIEGPVARCGECGFRTALDGEWKTTSGILEWKGKADPLSARGPSVDCCCESEHLGQGTVEFTQLELDGMPVPEVQYNLIKVMARHGRFAWQRSLMDPGDGDDPL